MARIPVRIESAEEGKEFQRFIFERGWTWQGSMGLTNISDHFVKDLKLLYFLYTDRKILTYSNCSCSTGDYYESISVREAKAKLFVPSIIEVDDE